MLRYRAPRQANFCPAEVEAFLSGMEPLGCCGCCSSFVAWVHRDPGLWDRASLPYMSIVGAAPRLATCSIQGSYKNNISNYSGLSQ